MELAKADVLAECQGCSPEQLRVAYCYSGCDDIVTKVDRLGFDTALKFAKRDMGELEDACGDAFQTICGEMKELEADVEVVPLCMEAVVEVPLDAPSILDVFLDETDEAGNPRRSQLAVKVREMLQGNWAAPKKPNQQDKSKPRKDRIRDENKRVADKERKRIPFVLPTHNVYALLADMENANPARGR